MAIALGLGGAVDFLVFEPPDPVRNVLFAIAAIGIAVAGAMVLAETRRTEVELQADAVELQGAVRRRRLAYADIAGFRTEQQRRDTPQIRLISRHPHARSLRLPAHLDVDAHFKSWLGSLVDLDARDQKNSLDDVLADPALAGSADERRAQLDSARRIAQLHLWTTTGIGLWAILYPHPLGLVVTCAGLLLCIALFLAARKGAMYRLTFVRNDLRADLSRSVILPPPILTLLALDAHVLDHGKLIGLAVAAACVMLLLLFDAVNELRTQIGAALLVAVAVVVCSYAGLRLVNQRLDHGAAETYVVPVLAKYPSMWFKRTCTLGLRSWDSRWQELRVDAAPAMCGELVVGQSLCIRQRRGALGVRWFELRECRAD